MKTRILLMRHAHSKANKQDLVGIKNSSLSTQGIKGLKKLKLPFEIDVVYASDFTRSIQTAQLLSRNPDYILPELGERYFGELENEPGQKGIKLLKKFMDSLPREYRHQLKFTHDMESDFASFTRLDTALKSVIPTHEGKNILVVSHSNIMRMWLIYSGFTDFYQLSSGSIENLGFVVIEWNKHLRPRLTHSKGVNYAK